MKQKPVNDAGMQWFSFAALLMYAVIIYFLETELAQLQTYSPGIVDLEVYSKDLQSVLAQWIFHSQICTSWGRPCVRSQPRQTCVPRLGVFIWVDNAESRNFA